jgi:hypothetical protein
MSFAVQPQALVEFAALVERNGINLSLSNVHLSAESNLGNTDGLWLQHLIDAHIPTLDRMSGSLYRAFHVMGASADELARTADHYRTTDQAAEANLDATYPASPQQTDSAPRRHGDHSEVDDRAAAGRDRRGTRQCDGGGLARGRVTGR